MQDRFWLMMNQAAVNEAETIDFYREMANRAPSRALNRSIGHIIEDEMEHQVFFQSVLNGREVDRRRGQEDDLKGVKYEKKRVHGRKIKLPRVAEPYPPIKVERPNPEYARLLLDDYAGTVSEMTAVTQYLYHRNDLPKKYAEVAGLLEAIAVVEMGHLETLAQLIMLLGQPPMYMNGRGQLWDAGCVSYLTGKPCEQLQANIEQEQAAIRAYRRHVAMINDRHVKAVLNRMIKDEELHLRLFCKMQRRYCRS